MQTWQAVHNSSKVSACMHDRLSNIKVTRMNAQMPGRAAAYQR
jgi:hypothetical protein